MKFEAIHKTLNTVSVELVGSVITYKGFPKIVTTQFHLNSKKNLEQSQINNRELEVLELICKGKSTLRLLKPFSGAATLKPTEQTFRKTDSKNIAELMMYAIRYRLIIIDNRF
jgi:DNA-binding CsgD family transcriptional regulator